VDTVFIFNLELRWEECREAPPPFLPSSLPSYTTTIYLHFQLSAQLELEWCTGEVHDRCGAYNLPQIVFPTQEAKKELYIYYTGRQSVVFMLKSAVKVYDSLYHLPCNRSET
jgi:hypothetical protein